MNKMSRVPNMAKSNVDLSDRVVYRHKNNRELRRYASVDSLDLVELPKNKEDHGQHEQMQGNSGKSHSSMMRRFSRMLSFNYEDSLAKDSAKEISENNVENR